jgi:hypothetical protein
MRLFSRIMGWLFVSVGTVMILGFLNFWLTSKSARPFLVSLETVVIVGVLPFFGGVMLLMRRSRPLRSAMGWICGACIAVFILAGGAYFLFRDDTPKAFGGYAASALLGALVSAAIGLVAALRCRETRSRTPADDETRRAHERSLVASAPATRQRHIIFNVIGLTLAGYFTLSVLGMILGRYREAMILRAGLVTLLVGLGSLVNLAERRLVVVPTLCMITGYFVSMFLAPLGVWGIVELARGRARHRRRPRADQES